jgi:hypothetical protein
MANFAELEKTAEKYVNLKRQKKWTKKEWN